MNGSPENARCSYVGRLVATTASVGLATLFVTADAQAQVTTDTTALNAFGGAAPQQAAKPKPVARKTEHRVEHKQVVAPAPVVPPSSAPQATNQTTQPAQQTVPASPASTPSTAAAPAHPVTPPPAATIPLAPPPPPVLTPPPIPVELHPFPMPPDPAPVKDAVGEVRPIVGGLRITFAPDSDHLNQDTKNAVLAFAKMLKEQPDIRGLVDITASGVPNDPSRPRRMSLSRGLAIRAVLMNAGIPSTRIYIRVIGLPGKTGIETPADRADMRRSDEVPAQ